MPPGRRRGSPVPPAAPPPRRLPARGAPVGLDFDVATGRLGDVGVGQVYPLRQARPHAGALTARDRVHLDLGPAVTRMPARDDVAAAEVLPVRDHDRGGVAVVDGPLVDAHVDRLVARVDHFARSGATPTTTMFTANSSRPSATTRSASTASSSDAVPARCEPERPRQIRRTVGPELDACAGPVAHRRGERGVVAGDVPLGRTGRRAFPRLAPSRSSGSSSVRPRRSTPRRHPDGTRRRPRARGRGSPGREQPHRPGGAGRCTA